MLNKCSRFSGALFDMLWLGFLLLLGAVEARLSHRESGAWVEGPWIALIFKHRKDCDISKLNLNELSISERVHLPAWLKEEVEGAERDKGLMGVPVQMKPEPRQAQHPSVISENPSSSATVTEDEPPAVITGRIKPPAVIPGTRRIKPSKVISESTPLNRDNSSSPLVTSAIKAPPAIPGRTAALPTVTRGERRRIRKQPSSNSVVGAKESKEQVLGNIEPTSCGDLQIEAIPLPSPSSADEKPIEIPLTRKIKNQLGRVNCSQRIGYTSASSKSPIDARIIALNYLDRLEEADFDLMIGECSLFVAMLYDDPDYRKVLQKMASLMGPVRKKLFRQGRNKPFPDNWHSQMTSLCEKHKVLVEVAVNLFKDENWITLFGAEKHAAVLAKFDVGTTQAPAQAAQPPLSTMTSVATSSSEIPAPIVCPPIVKEEAPLLIRIRREGHGLKACLVALEEITDPDSLHHDSRSLVEVEVIDIDSLSIPSSDPYDDFY